MEEFLQSGDIPLADAGVFPIQIEGQIAPQGDKLAGDAGLLGIDLEVFLELGPRGGVGVGQHLVEGPPLLDEGGGLFRAHEGHPGNIVDRISHQRLEVDDLVGTDSPVGQQVGGGQVLVLADLVDLHAVAQQLPQVFVIADDAHLHLAGFRLGGEGRQHIVGLPAGNFDQGDAEGANQFLHHGKLGDERLGGLGAMGLVGGIPAFPFARAGGIAGTDEMGGLFLAEDVEDVAGEAEGGIRRQTPRTGHFRNRMENLKDKGVNVDQINGLRHGEVPGAREAPIMRKRGGNSQSAAVQGGSVRDFCGQGSRGFS